MKLEYKTGRLPLNFVILGYMLLAISVWRIAVYDWKGMPFLLLSVFLVFLKSGIIVDTDIRKIKMYIGIFFFKKGKWEDIEQLSSLRIVKVREARTMNVLSISRTETYDSYKLYLILPDRNIELMAGSKADILSKASCIASSLNTSLSEGKELEL